MKAHLSQHFPVILQLCSFFKCSAKPYEHQLPQLIKQMTVDELHANIMNFTYQTTLMKQIIKFLLSKLCDPNHFLEGVTNQLLTSNLEKYAQQMRQQYYMQMALQQHFMYVGEIKNAYDYTNMYTFYGLKTDLKFQVLSSLTKRTVQYMRKGKGDKKQEGDSKQTKKQEQKNKADKIQEILILGEDNESLYMFAPFLPEYVLQTKYKKWNLLNKEAVILKIKKLLEEQMSTSNLFLIENLSSMEKEYMAKPSQVDSIIRIHRVKQNNAVQEPKCVQKLKDRLKQINRRYNYFLKNFKNRCWGYLKQREKYEHMLKQATTFADLIEAFKYFYECSNKYLFICLCDDESAIPQQNCQQFYKTQNRPTCNINTVFIIYKLNESISSSKLSKIIFSQQSADSYAMFQLNVCVLQLAVTNLEIKQQKYFQKQAKRIAQEGEAEQKKQAKPVKYANEHRLRVRPERKSESNSRISNESKINKGPELRQKKTKNKKYGVTLIDSDQQSSDLGTNSDCSFQKYSYGTRSMINR